MLRICYAIGTVGMPAVAWLFWRWLTRKAPIVDRAARQVDNLFRRLTTRRQRFWLAALILLTFVCAEIVWRMMFEYFIAYLQFRDALVQMQTHGLTLQAH